jgi:hypothetical protein
MTLSHATGTGQHPRMDRGVDLYETAPEAVMALLSVETLARLVWEPCAGRGNIVNTLRSVGHGVVASDLICHGFPLHFCADFLETPAAPPGIEAIVTNPPFKLAAEFVAHALELVPFVVMLLRLAFLESEHRSLILDSGQLARIHVFRNRPPMMHRDGWKGPKASSAMCFAWMVWDRNHRGPTTIDRISWRAP